MEKTAMQELMHYIKTVNTITFLPEQLAKTIEEKYLEKEKEQIIDAYSEGYSDGVQEPNPNDEYYNQTYNQNK